MTTYMYEFFEWEKAVNASRHWAGIARTVRVYKAEPGRAGQTWRLEVQA